MSNTNESDHLTCPCCGADMDVIGCEKTTTCPTCKREWKYGSRDDSHDPPLEEVGEDDPIYWDR